MKRIVALFFIFSNLTGLLAQVADKMSYQAVIRNNLHQLVENQSVGLRICILQGSAEGTTVYRETYNPLPITNAYGLVTVEIGAGIPDIGTFSGIDWSAGPYFLKTETDPTGGSNYTITGTSQILSVPYAFYAKTADVAIIANDTATRAYVDSIRQKFEILEDLVYTELSLSEGLVAYYPFNGNAKDESGSGFNGSVTGATLTNDRFGRANKAYMFTESEGNYITINSAIGNFGQSDFTLSVWAIRRNSTANEIFSQKGTTYTNSSWWELTWGSFIVHENLAYEAKININYEDTLSSNIWYHFVAIRQSNVLRLYLNGVLVEETDSPQILNIDNSTNSRIGCNFFNTPLQCFDGALDDIRLYNRALSQPEIDALYKEGGYPEVLSGGAIDDTYHIVDWEGKVMTVHGLIPADSMGITLPHEHLLIVHQFNESDLTSESDAISESSKYSDAGGRTLVEVTNIGIARNPQALKRIATATGLNVIMGSGFYKTSLVPDSFKNMSVEQLTQIIVNDIKNGIDGIHAGVIGEIGISRPITQFERKVLAAAAHAQLSTGAAIIVHFDRNGTASERHLALDILEEEGADLTRVVISHNTPYVNLIDDYVTYVQRGCYIAFDMLGLEVILYFNGDLDPAGTIKNLIERGYINNILVSQDLCFTNCYTINGGYGYAHILNDLVPEFKAAGITDSQISNIMVDNPKRLLPLKDYTKF